MTASKSFFLGDVVVLDIDVSVESTDTDPTVVTFYILDATGSITTPSTTNETGTGVFSARYETISEGWHRFRITGTAPASFAREGSFYVHGETLDEPVGQPET